MHLEVYKVILNFNNKTICHRVGDVLTVPLHPHRPVHGLAVEAAQRRPPAGRPGLQVGAGQPQRAVILYQVNLPDINNLIASGYSLLSK